MFTKSKFSAAHQKSALYLEKQKTLKNSAKCALCSAKCALCGSVGSDLTAPFKRPQKKMLMLKISEKSVKKQKIRKNSSNQSRSILLGTQSIASEFPDV